MVRIGQRWNAAALGMVLALSLVAACKKDSKDGGAAGEQGGGKSGAANSDLSLLPVDSELVMGINAGQIRQSPLWKQIVEPMVMSGQGQGKLSELKAKCGYDPTTSVSSVSIGVKAQGDNPDGVMVLHGIDKAKSSQCADAMKDEMAKQGVQLTRDGDIWLVKNERAGFSAAAKFVDDSTAISVFGEHADAGGVKAAASGGSTLKTSPAFVEMYKKVKTSDSLWFIVNGRMLEKAPVKATAAFGSLNVTDGLSLDVRVRFEKPEAAAEAANLVNMQVKQAANFVDKADVKSEGSELQISIVMSNQKLQSLMTEYGPLLSMFLGGMGG